MTEKSFEEIFEERVAALDSIPVLTRRFRNTTAAVWSLNGTQFQIRVYYGNDPYWEYKLIDRIHVYSFEEVLQRIPESLIEPLLFHIDLFRNT